MEDWTKFSDAQVFGGASEQPGSQGAYRREIEIKRRLYLLESEALRAQLDATQEQREAIKEMRSQSRIMFWSVIGIFATAVVTLAGAFIN